MAVSQISSYQDVAQLMRANHGKNADEILKEIADQVTGEKVDYDNNTITFANGLKVQFSNDGSFAIVTNGESSVTIDMTDESNPKIELDVKGLKDGSEAEETAEANLEKAITQQAIDTAGEDYGSGGTAKAKAKGGSWWMALFAKLGEQLNAEATKLEGMLDSISGGNDKPGDLLLASAQMQRLGFMMSQDGAIVSSFGSGAKGLAEGAK